MSTAKTYPGERMALNADEFATRWAVSPEYIHALRKAGKLPYLRDGRKGFAFPVVSGDRAMQRATLTAKTDAMFVRDRRNVRRVGRAAR